MLRHAARRLTNQASSLEQSKLLQSLFWTASSTQSTTSCTALSPVASAAQILGSHRDASNKLFSTAVSPSGHICAPTASLASLIVCSSALEVVLPYCSHYLYLSIWSSLSRNAEEVLRKDCVALVDYKQFDKILEAHGMSVREILRVLLIFRPCSSL